MPSLITRGYGPNPRILVSGFGPPPPSLAMIRDQVRRGSSSIMDILPDVIYAVKAQLFRVNREELDEPKSGRQRRLIRRNDQTKVSAKLERTDTQSVDRGIVIKVQPKFKTRERDDS